MTTEETVFVPATEEDESLLCARMPIQFTPSTEEIHALASAAAAFVLACRASGLTDKEIYSHIGIDGGYFSNIKTGKATLQADKEAAFCTRVGNRIYPEWRAHQIGCSLVVMQSEAERRAIAAETENAELAKENALLRELMREKMVAQ